MRTFTYEPFSIRAFSFTNFRTLTFYIRTFSVTNILHTNLIRYEPFPLRSLRTLSHTNICLRTLAYEPFLIRTLCLRTFVRLPPPGQAARGSAQYPEWPVATASPAVRGAASGAALTCCICQSAAGGGRGHGCDWSAGRLRPSDWRRPAL